jgi:hypothetical protein
MVRVVRRAIWEGGGTRTGFGFGGKDFEGYEEDAVVPPSPSRPERMWIAAVSVCGRVRQRRDVSGRRPRRTELLLEVDLAVGFQLVWELHCVAIGMSFWRLIIDRTAQVGLVGGIGRRAPRCVVRVRRG